jgi:hypothetical protein
MFQTGIPVSGIHEGYGSIHGGLSHSAIGFKTKKDRDTVLKMIQDNPFYQKGLFPSGVVKVNYFDGELRMPMKNTTQLTDRSKPKDKQPAYLVLQ